jgi:hypothetical protein
MPQKIKKHKKALHVFCLYQLMEVSSGGKTVVGPDVDSMEVLV